MTSIYPSTHLSIHPHNYTCWPLYKQISRDMACSDLGLGVSSLASMGRRNREHQQTGIHSTLFHTMWAQRLQSFPVKGNLKALPLCSCRKPKEEPSRNDQRAIGRIIAFWQIMGQAGTFLGIFLPFPVPLQWSLRFVEFWVHPSSWGLISLPSWQLPLKHLPSLENK